MWRVRREGPDGLRGCTHNTQQYLVTLLSRKRSWKKGNVSSLGQDAGAGAKSYAKESLLWCRPAGTALPLLTVGGAAPTAGTTGRNWQGQATKASRPGRGKLPGACGEELPQD